MERKTINCHLLNQNIFFQYPVRFICLILVISFLTGGCSFQKRQTYNGYYIYCLDTNETRVVGEEYTPKKERTEELTKELLERMDKEPETISLKKAIPENVDIEEFTLSKDGNLCIYWPSSYGNYTGVSETLRRAAIVKTLCQIPDIRSVEFYVAGQPLTDSNMNAIGYMTAETFIDNTGEEAYTQDTTLNVYFADSSGTSLIKLPIKVTYDATIPIEQLVVEQLIAGPEKAGRKQAKNMLRTMPEGTKLNKISVKEHTCYIDLSNEFLEKRSDISAEVTIYSVVNTLVELSSINKVQFSIDGEQVLYYDDYFKFGDPFESNLDIVK